jgi:hypothetical protein
VSGGVIAGALKKLSIANSENYRFGLDYDGYDEHV